MDRSAVLLLLAIAVGVCNARTSAKRDENHVMEVVLLQFSLEGDDPYYFAGYASEFARGLEEILLKGDMFDSVNAVVLGVGKTECGISVIAVVEFTKNQTSLTEMELEDTVEYIIETIENNKSVFEDIYSMKSVKTVQVDTTNLRHANQKTSAMVIAGACAGTLGLIGLAVLAAALMVYAIRKKRGFEKVPLLADEGDPGEQRWLKLPWNKKSTTEDPPGKF